VQRLVPEPRAELSDEDFCAAYEFPIERPWIRASLLVSLDGATSGGDGSSRSIASPSDRRVFSMLRLRSDVVLVGAGTVRSEHYGPSRRTVAVVTRRLDLSSELPLFSEADPAGPRTIVFTTDAAAESAPHWLRDAADIVACGPDDVDLPAVVAELHRRDLGRIHCEGGPALVSALVGASLVDEFALTISPVIMGADSTGHLVSRPTVPPATARWHHVHVFEEDGTVFLRLRRP
jgi:riboflavin-specific deaminase-like protein